MRSDHPSPQEREEEPISLSRIATTLHTYSAIILIALAATAAAYLIVATMLLLAADHQRVTSLPFRLEFKGADQGQYPNGLKFSISDITATPVLLDVYAGNELSRFVTFDQFSRSLFVLEANRELEQLSAEYQSRLSDPKLTPVDRERITREFESKRAAISKSDYTIQFLKTPNVERIPAPLVPKIMGDALRTWARRAAVEKKALNYKLSAISPNLISDVSPDQNGYLVSILLLRRRLNDASSNIDEIATIPGSELVRTSTDHLSLDEIRLKLDDLMRFKIEPLIEKGRAGGLMGSPSHAMRILKTQLEHDERALAAARGKESALRETLRAYESEASPADLKPSAGAETATRSDQRETVMPQLSEGFLDRIVDLTERGGNREYRQEMAEQIKNASLDVLPFEAAVQYDRQLIEHFDTGAASEPVTPDAFRQEWTAVTDEARQLIKSVNEIYVLASRQLYPETELYRVLGPPATAIHRSVSTTRLILGGVVVLLVALPIILIGVFVHARIREERRSEPIGAAASSSV